nr:hypothetical protein HK105_006319 [Polyrhizophydium stewartii]
MRAAAGLRADRSLPAATAWLAKRPKTQYPCLHALWEHLAGLLADESALAAAHQETDHTTALALLDAALAEMPLGEHLHLPRSYYAWLFRALSVPSSAAAATGRPLRSSTGRPMRLSALDLASLLTDDFAASAHLRSMADLYDILDAMVNPRVKLAVLDRTLQLLADAGQLPHVEDLLHYIDCRSAANSASEAESWLRSQIGVMQVRRPRWTPKGGRARELGDEAMAAASRDLGEPKHGEAADALPPEHAGSSDPETLPTDAGRKKSQQPHLLSWSPKLFLQLVHNHCVENDLERVLELLDEMAKLGIQCQWTEARALHHVCSTGDMQMAREMFDKFRARTERPAAKLFGVMIWGYLVVDYKRFVTSKTRSMMAGEARVARRTQFDHAAMVSHVNEVLVEYNKHYRKPTITIINSYILHFLIRRQFDRCLALFEDLEAQGIAPIANTYAIMMKVFFEMGDPERAEALLVEMRAEGIDADVVHYATAMHGYLERNELARAIEMYRQMQMQGIRPNMYVYHILLCVYGQLYELASINRVWNEMLQANIRPNEMSYSILLYGLGRLGDLPMAMRVFESMRQKRMQMTAPTFNTLMAIHMRNRQTHKVQMLFDEMMANGVEPDIITFNLLMKAQVVMQSSEQAARIIAEMNERGVDPSTATYIHLLQLYSLTGHDDEARRVHGVFRSHAAAREELGYSLAHAHGTILRYQTTRSDWSAFDQHWREYMADIGLDEDGNPLPRRPVGQDGGEAAETESAAAPAPEAMQPSVELTAQAYEVLVRVQFRRNGIPGMMKWYQRALSSGQPLKPRMFDFVIRKMIAVGAVDETAQVIADMQARGINPDIVTFTRVMQARAAAVAAASTGDGEADTGRSRGLAARAVGGGQAEAGTGVSAAAAPGGSRSAGRVPGDGLGLGQVQEVLDTLGPSTMDAFDFELEDDGVEPRADPSR